MRHPDYFPVVFEIFYFSLRFVCFIDADAQALTVPEPYLDAGRLWPLLPRPLLCLHVLLTLGQRARRAPAFLGRTSRGSPFEPLQNFLSFYFWVWWRAVRTRAMDVRTTWILESPEAPPPVIWPRQLGQHLQGCRCFRSSSSLGPRRGAKLAWPFLHHPPAQTCPRPRHCQGKEVNRNILNIRHEN